MTTPCLSEDQLLAYVAGHPDGGDPAAVQAHVDRCAGCRAALGEAARALRPSDPAQGPPGEARTLLDGDEVGGRYRIRRFVARGGMGEVYEAEDLLLHDTVALKTLVCTALDDEPALFRFRAEVRLARKVTHPNVCRILEYGVHARQQPGLPAESIPFLTMEFLTGETLAQRIRRAGPLGDAAALAVVVQIVGGLEAIHRAGIVHRDLKAENVFLVPDGGGGERVVVVDFGLARALDGSVASTWPRGGTFVGTIDCMAPEQIEGRPPTPAVDVYTLGVVIFELVTGRRPFVNVPVLKRLREPAPRPSSVAPHLAPIWDDVVGRCLEGDPAARFPSPAAALAALTQGLAPGSAPPDLPAPALPPPRPPSTPGTPAGGGGLWGVLDRIAGGFTRRIRALPGSAAPGPETRTRRGPRS